MRKEVVLAVMGILVVASLTIGYFSGASNRTAETVTSTTTLMAGTTSTTSTICTATGGIGCPHSLNDSFTISVTYAGPWGLSYQGYLGDPPSGQLVKSGNFYGHTSANETVTVAGVSVVGTTICAEAQKLDASTSTLVLKHSFRI